jgi:hypothetical protein
MAAWLLPLHPKAGVGNALSSTMLTPFSSTTSMSPHGMVILIEYRSFEAKVFSSKAQTGTDAKSREEKPQHPHLIKYPTQPIAVLPY